MCAAVDLERQPRVVGAGGQAARRRSRRGAARSRSRRARRRSCRSRCSRSASQAPPDQMPTSAVSGCSSARTPPSSRRTALRRRGAGVLMASSAAFRRNCSRMIAADGRIDVARARGARFGRACSARRPRAPAAGSGRAAGARSAARGAYCRARAPSGWNGTPTTSASGCHSAISAPIASKRASPLGGDGAQRLRACASACCRWRRRRAGCRSRKRGRNGGERQAAAVGEPAATRSCVPCLLAQHARHRCRAATAPCRSAARPACRR